MTEVVLADDWPRLAYLALLLLSVAGFVLVEMRQRPGRTLRQALAWGLIFIGVVAAAGLWTDTRTRLAPQYEGGRITVPRGADGHYRLTAQVNGTPVGFVIDTGASQLVLSARDARRIGLDPDTLAYVQRAQTANGEVAMAPVRLDRVTLGPMTDSDVGAVVSQGALPVSLMGMSYLSSFARVGFEGGLMTLER